MFEYTEEELNKIIETHFISKEPMVLRSFPPKEKKKYLCLLWMIQKFEYKRIYTELEVNEIIKQMYHDFPTIRRAFIDYGFLDRLQDGSQYWRIE